MAIRRIFQLASLVRDVGLKCFQHSPLTRPSLVASIHTSVPRLDLSEFFEDPKNLSKDIIQVGRSWRKEELRLKSNTDLHKLWYVLLKERNMLMTMEHFCKEEYILFPNPERIDKVKESMENLEDVVRERNRAYWQLETGESGERPGKLVPNQLGMRFFYRKFEHVIPHIMNKKWHRHHKHYYDEKEVKPFLSLLNEKRWLRKRKLKIHNQSQAAHILKRWPDADLEAVKTKYPKADIEKIKKNKRAAPHKYIPPEST